MKAKSIKGSDIMELIIGLFGLLFWVIKLGFERIEHKTNTTETNNYLDRQRHFEMLVYDDQYESEVDKYILDNYSDAKVLAKTIYPAFDFYNQELIKLILMSQHGKIPKFDIPRLGCHEYFKQITWYVWCNIVGDVKEDEWNKYIDDFIRWYEKTMQSHGVPGQMVTVRKKYVCSQKAGNPGRDCYYYHPVSDTTKPIYNSVMWEVFLPIGSIREN